MRRAILIGAILALAGCAEQSAMRLSADTVRINVSTAPIYGALEPEKRAMAMAAQETLRNGYERFIIVDGQTGFRRNTIAVLPAQASGGWSAGPYGGGGSWNATGPRPIGMSRFEAAVLVKMFRRGDAGYDGAIDAREIMRAQP